MQHGSVMVCYGMLWIVMVCSGVLWHVVMVCWHVFEFQTMTVPSQLLICFDAEKCSEVFTPKNRYMMSVSFRQKHAKANRDRTTKNIHLKKIYSINIILHIYIYIIYYHQIACFSC